MSRELLEKLVRRVVQKIKANTLDLPFNLQTKVPLDVAVQIVTELITSPDPPDYFTVPAMRSVASSSSFLCLLQLLLVVVMLMMAIIVLDTFYRHSSWTSW